MTNHFLGCNTLVKMMILKQLVLCFFLGAFVMAKARENPILELSSKEDLVEVAGYGEEKLSVVTITGQVLCHAGVDENAQPLSGASVAVFCGHSGKRRKSRARSTTDAYGDFLIDLPSHLHAIPNLEKICHLKVVEIPKNSFCYHAFTGKHQRIKLSSIDDGLRIYTAQRIRLTSKLSKACKRRRGKKEETSKAY